MHAALHAVQRAHAHATLVTCLLLTSCMRGGSDPNASMLASSSSCWMLYASVSGTAAAHSSSAVANSGATRMAHCMFAAASRMFMSLVLPMSNLPCGRVWEHAAAEAWRHEL